MRQLKTELDDRLHWYKDAVIYELHIKAFRDGNNDGIGDFEGLLEKLDYLQSLGITAIWVLPFYPSPLKDDGYDIADYYNINPAYGDIKQFKKLLKEAHKRNMKVITELVINHTSDQHPWFQRARKAPKDSPNRNYYVWTDDPKKFKDARIIFQDFESSNWTWDPVAQQYYWHRFFFHQPDLNYDNPLVQEEVFKIISYWCKMGVNGFRLDAVPYLFERDETNCENLPETHDFLKKLRAYVDQNFPGTLLLAEANMWPEDSAAYFGDGNECQMNYHFPLMPRMFMALQMEDRYPITDIFDQTPEIPETCQWAIFLRNHDELTLEMVTDEERDYMYKAYVRDPKAKINLGIRHRLAPLMENNRKKIELLNYLLFSLPGTPVIYYGDEIGMGDNFYLGDRDGVRTPMQWNADRNSGFSEVNPHQLYLPIILDPEYHYESVNVEMQTRNSSSLLWWMKRIINVRKNYKAFSRGKMAFIDSDNSKVMTFVRTYEDERMLVVVNLSRYVQPVELTLHEYEGYFPVEVFSKNKFPLIKNDTPYFLTIGPYDCQWFILQKAHADIDERKSLPRLELTNWKDILLKENIEELEVNVLPDYLMKVRWFGGKGRSVHRIKIEDHAVVPLPENNSSILLLIAVQYESGIPDIYQLAVSFAKEQLASKLQENCPKSVLSFLKIGKEEGVLYDGLFAPELQQAIFTRMANHENITLKDSKVRFYGNKLLKRFVKEQTKARSNVLSAEQSNTSITYGNQFFLKIYRKVDHAINPDLEIIHFLTEKSKFKNIPAFIGAIEWQYKKSSIVLGMMQEQIENQGDAWTYMLGRLNYFYEDLLSRNEATNFPELQGSITDPLSIDDLPEYITEMLSGPVIELISLLGKRTGEMHIALSSVNDVPDFQPEEFSLHYQRSLFSSFQTLVRETFQNQSKNLKRLPDYLKSEVEEILSMKADILNIYKRIYRKKIAVVKTRIHGDYHLGQVLFTGKDFVILDFEGEPARPYSERRLKRSPLRDVAGMLRSFHYAAYSGLFFNEEIGNEDRSKLLPNVEQWYQSVSQIFMYSYLETVKDRPFIPDDKEDLEVLVQTYLLEKVIYELNYELNNRPDWAIIPLKGIKSLIEKINVGK